MSKHRIRDWLGLKTPFDWKATKWLGPTVGAIGFLVILFLVVVFFAFLYRLGMLAFSFDDNVENLNFYTVGLFVVGFIGLPFAIWRSWVAQRTADIQQSGLITDRINKSVENLGARYENGKPNRVVRIGAILALERIGQEAPDFHIQIMEILTGYVRAERREKFFTTYDEIQEQRFAESDQEAYVFDQVEREAEAQKITIDSQQAITVIGRRNDFNSGVLVAIERASNYFVDLRASLLASADMSHGFWEKTNFA